MSWPSFWFLVAPRVSFKHPVKTSRVTVAGKPSDDLAPGTLNSILKQAGLTRKPRAKFVRLSNLILKGFAKMAWPFRCRSASLNILRSQPTLRSSGTT
ncbi:MAG: type II toxin-antitoxin system HicA family toxin [Sulfuricella sp.]|nr:type II toxin-antitoxin system HicA family toxin [Sulfuricella sp.]